MCVLRIHYSISFLYYRSNSLGYYRAAFPRWSKEEQGIYLAILVLERWSDRICPSIRPKQRDRQTDSVGVTKGRVSSLKSQVLKFAFNLKTLSQGWKVLLCFVCLPSTTSTPTLTIDLLGTNKQTIGTVGTD